MINNIKMVVNLFCIILRNCICVLTSQTESNNKINQRTKYMDKQININCS